MIRVCKVCRVCSHFFKNVLKGSTLALTIRWEKLFDTSFVTSVGLVSYQSLLAGEANSLSSVDWLKKEALFYWAITSIFWFSFLVSRCFIALGDEAVVAKCWDDTNLKQGFEVRKDWNQVKKWGASNWLTSEKSARQGENTGFSEFRLTPKNMR